MPPVWIDSPKVERAWINLASNAIEFAKTSVKVEAGLVGGTLRIRILDDGPGVPDSILPRLFQRGATYGKPGGTGLGLAYVKLVMQGHGGDVSYHRMDEWTVFECHIPNAIAVIHRAPEPNLDEPKTSPKSPKYVKVAVCIEPEAENLRLIEMLLAENFEGIKFTEVRGEADLVISNSEDIMIEVLESDSQEYFSVASFKDTSRMFEILKRKLGSNPS